jgi:catechol 2,3-dioxygenase-like lactoylglutathione lyase family enzyme
MLAYVTLGTKDLKIGAAFYDELLALIGGRRMMSEEGFVAWTDANNGPGLGLTYPFNKAPATVGNGVMVALQCASTDQVDAMYQKALALGGVDEGAPGWRLPWFYAGYFRDLDGNKLNVCFMKQG